MNSLELTNLSSESLEKYIQTINKVKDAILNGGLDNYLKEKGETALDNIMKKEDVDSDQRASDYIAGNKVEIKPNEIVFINDSEIDIASQDTWFNDYGKEFYPEKLSLADLIEYGTGIIGSQSSKNTGKEWEYMMNPNRDYKEGWEWNNNGVAVHTEGQAGRYIYYGLTEEINAKLETWIEDFFKGITGGNV